MNRVSERPGTGASGRAGKRRNVDRTAAAMPTELTLARHACLFFCVCGGRGEAERGKGGEGVEMGRSQGAASLVSDRRPANMAEKNQTGHKQATRRPADGTREAAS